MGSSIKKTDVCAECGQKLLHVAHSRTQVWCDDCQHAEETEPACTCLLPADVLGWPHSKHCPVGQRRAALIATTGPYAGMRIPIRHIGERAEQAGRR